ADAAVALRLRHHVHGDRGLAGRLGPVDLDHPAPGQTTDPESDVEGQCAGGDGLHVHVGALAHTHDRALPELLVDLAHGHLERLVSLHDWVPFSTRRIGRPRPYAGGVTITSVELQQRNSERLFDQGPNGREVGEEAWPAQSRASAADSRSSYGCQLTLDQLSGGAAAPRQPLEKFRFDLRSNVCSSRVTSALPRNGDSSR